MIPQLLTVRIRSQRGRLTRLWIPLLPVAVVLSPLLVLAVLGIVIACLVYRINAARALYTGWRLVCGSRGTRVDIEQGRVAVLVHIR